MQQHARNSGLRSLANLGFWQNLVNSRDGEFAVEEVTVFGDRANIRWRYRFDLDSR